MCRSWAFLEALYRAGSGWRVGFDGAEERTAIKRETSIWMRKSGDHLFSSSITNLPYILAKFQVSLSSSLVTAAICIEIQMSTSNKCIRLRTHPNWKERIRRICVMSETWRVHLSTLVIFICQ
jgi:hypothetical protein